MKRKHIKKLENSYQFLQSEGEMGTLIRATDWSKTPVGPIENWPQSLRTAISIILNSAFPMLIMWGKDEYTQFYNDAFIDIQGKKHPNALGMSGKLVWQEIWKEVGPLIDSVFAIGKTVSMKELPLILNRNGYDEQTYFDFSYSAIRDETGKIEGMFCVCFETTEQITSQKKLLAEQQRLKDLLMQTPAMIAVTRGPQLVFELANPLYLKVLGKTENIIGKSVLDVFPEIKGQPIKEILFNVYKTGVPYIGTEVPMKLDINNDGVLEDIYFTFVYQPIRGLDGKVDGIMNYAVDVTEHVLARKKAEESEARLRAIIEATPECIKIVSPDGTLEFMNSSGLEMIEGEEDLLGKACVYNVISPEYKKEWIKNHKKVTSGKSLNWEFDIIGLKGTRHRMETHAVPLRNSDGTVSQLAVTRDITARYKAAEALGESEEKFRTLADNIPNLAWMAKPDGYIFWYNSKWYEYTGTTPEDMEGWGWKKVHHPNTLETVLEQWQKSIATKTAFNMVFPLKGKDGTFRSFLTKVNPVKDGKGNVIRWFGTNTDITEQKELEQQKDEFLGIASHELKTPVTSIKAYGQVLQTMFRRKGDTSSAALLGKMDAQIDKLTSLISDLLDVTKIHSGKLVMQEEEYDFKELVDNLVDELQLTTERHSLVKQLDKTKKLYGDKERIGQVITNLITNAIKYSPHTNKIIIKTENDTNTVTLCVQDFGVGIPKDKKDKVFEQFFRVSGEKQHTFPGLGLGLYISSEIVKRQEGRIWVESVEGKGSTFCFTLPIKKKGKTKLIPTIIDEESIKHE